MTSFVRLNNYIAGSLQKYKILLDVIFKKIEINLLHIIMYTSYFVPQL